MLDPWFHATTFLASVYAAEGDLDLAARCLFPKGRFYGSGFVASVILLLAVSEYVLASSPLSGTRDHMYASLKAFVYRGASSLTG
jgi:hypothetical protein